MLSLENFIETRRKQIPDHADGSARRWEEFQIYRDAMCLLANELPESSGRVLRDCVGAYAEWVLGDRIIEQNREESYVQRRGQMPSRRQQQHIGPLKHANASPDDSIEQRAAKRSRGAMVPLKEVVGRFLKILMCFKLA